MKIREILTFLIIITLLLTGTVSSNEQISSTHYSYEDLIITPMSGEILSDDSRSPLKKSTDIEPPVNIAKYNIIDFISSNFGMPSSLFTETLTIGIMLLGAGALGLLITRRKLPEDPESRPMIVYNAIKDHPGVNMAQIQKLTEIPRSSINYTLYRLSLAGKIKKITDKRTGSYYPANTPVEGHEEFIQKVLIHEKPHKIFQTIINVPGISQRKLIEETGIPQTTLQWHLSQLAKYNAIEGVREKNTIHYTAIPDCVLLYNQLAEENKQKTEAENRGDIDQIPEKKATKTTDNTNES